MVEDKPDSDKFDQDNVLPDRAVFPYPQGSDIMDVTQFMLDHNSPLARMPVGGTRFGAFVKDCCKVADIRPEWVLVSLQREKRLVRRVDWAADPPSQRDLDWALGFGALDDGTFVERFKGLDNQIRECARGTRKILGRAANSIGHQYTLDAAKKEERDIVFPANAATYLVYEYTPHLDAARLTRSLYYQYFPALLA